MEPLIAALVIREALRMDGGSWAGQEAERKEHE